MTQINGQGRNYDQELENKSKKENRRRPERYQNVLCESEINIDWRFLISLDYVLVNKDKYEVFMHIMRIIVIQNWYKNDIFIIYIWSLKILAELTLKDTSAAGNE